jgi:hypothetical protein
MLGATAVITALTGVNELADQGQTIYKLIQPQTFSPKLWCGRESI